MLCAISLVEIGPLILKKKFVNVFSLFPYYFPLEKGVTLHLRKLESPSPKDALCQVWLKLAQWFLRRSRQKFTDRLRTTGDQKSSLELLGELIKGICRYLDIVLHVI